MRRLRISAISFLNTAPLMWDFDRTDVSQQFEISYTLPSQCAEALLTGTADIGIIPSITFATIPDLVILPDVAIASKKTVRSILLVTRKPLEHVRTVALDTSSRTSVALTQILLNKFLPTADDSPRQFIAMPPVVEEMLEKCDAGLLIGDPALRIDRTHYRAYDLAEVWQHFTGLPFVFAFWAVRQAALAEVSPDLDLAEIFSRSRDHGLQADSVSALAKLWAPKLEVSEAIVTTYLTRNIHYWLDSDNLAGLALFYRYAAELQLIPAAPAVKLLGTLASPISQS